MNTQWFTSIHIWIRRIKRYHEQAQFDIFVLTIVCNFFPWGLIHIPRGAILTSHLPPPAMTLALPPPPQPRLSPPHLRIPTTCTATAATATSQNLQHLCHLFYDLSRRRIGDSATSDAGTSQNYHHLRRQHICLRHLHRHYIIESLPLPRPHLRIFSTSNVVT